MIKLHFTIKGHKNTLSTHRNTLEFTKDKDLTLNGDCILGVDANFKITKDILKAKKIKITISSGDISDNIICDINPGFENDHEIVIRKSGFISGRTLGIHADKAAVDIDRRIVNILKDSNNNASVEIEGIL